MYEVLFWPQCIAITSEPRLHHRKPFFLEQIKAKNHLNVFDNKLIVQCIYGLVLYLCLKVVYSARYIFNKIQNDWFLLLLIIVYTYLVYVHIYFVFSHFFQWKPKDWNSIQLDIIKGQKYLDKFYLWKTYVYIQDTCKATWHDQHCVTVHTNTYNQ